MYTIYDLAEELNRQEWAVERMLKNRGYLKQNGDPRKATIDDGLMNKNVLITKAGWESFIDELGYKEVDDSEEEEVGIEEETCEEEDDFDDDDDEEYSDDCDEEYDDIELEYDDIRENVTLIDNEEVAVCPNCRTTATEDEATEKLGRDCDGQKFRFICSKCNLRFIATLDNEICECRDCNKRFSRQNGWDEEGRFCSKECQDKAWKPTHYNFSIKDSDFIRENVVIHNDLEVGVCPECHNCFSMEQGEYDEETGNYKFECEMCNIEFTAELNNVECEECGGFIADSEKVEKNNHIFCCCAHRDDFFSSRGKYNEEYPKN